MIRFFLEPPSPDLEYQLCAPILKSKRSAANYGKLIMASKWDRSFLHKSTIKRPQRQADACDHGVPGSLLHLRIGKIKAVDHAMRSTGKVASTIKDHSFAL
jgi:hypothetical protein